MNTNPNSRVLHMAHILKANRPDFAWSDMVRYAWYFHRFREALKAGVVTFSFFKEDGSIREAKGTLNGVLIPTEDLPKSGADNSSLPARRNSAEFPASISAGYYPASLRLLARHRMPVSFF